MIAVIDIGTVTARLALAEVAGGTSTQPPRILKLAKYSQIVQLGEGLAQSGVLADEAIARCLSCAAAFVQQAQEAGATHVVCTLTEAARRAKNAGILGYGLAELGLLPLIIPGAVEAALTFWGVSQDAPSELLLVADSGGGSTELALGRSVASQLELMHVTSLPLGCQVITDQFALAGGTPQQVPARLHEAQALAHEVFLGAYADITSKVTSMIPRSAQSLQGTLAKARIPRLMAVGGTVTSMIAAQKELVPYDSAQVHLAELSLAEVDELTERFAHMSVEERGSYPGMQAKRAPVILGGMVLISELLRAHSQAFGAEVLCITASESDLLFGLVLATAQVLAGNTPQLPLGWKPEVAALS